MTTLYNYAATVVSHTDGDTVVLSVDLGFKLTMVRPTRLYGINAPEKKTPEGVAAAAYLAGLIPIGSTLTIETQKDRDDKYGRLLAKLAFKAVDVSKAMVAAGHAKAYFGVGVKP